MTSVSPTGKSLPVLRSLVGLEKVITGAVVPTLVVALGAVYVTSVSVPIWAADAKAMEGDEAGQSAVGA